MSQAVLLPPQMTVAAFDEFLSRQNDDERWELVDGQILAMTGPTQGHQEIVDIVGSALRAAMPKDRRCRVNAGGLRVQMSEDERAPAPPGPT